MQELSLWGEIEDCTVKCKYNEPANDEIKIVFVPQVIVKSMSYFQVVELFCRLYEQTDYGNEIKKRPSTDCLENPLMRIITNFRKKRCCY